MGKLSANLTKIQFGTGSSGPSIVRGNISSGNISESSTGSALGTTVDFSAARVWNAVWNDIVDFQLLNDKLIYGKCYFDTKEGAKLCTTGCQLSVIGIASDTFGFGVGAGANKVEVPIAIGGWVLAFVDKEHPCGTPLTNDKKGDLVEMSLEEKQKYPERLVAIYKKPEPNQAWGPEGKQIPVNGRHWVKVKS